MLAVVVVVVVVVVIVVVAVIVRLLYHGLQCHRSFVSRILYS